MRYTIMGLLAMQNKFPRGLQQTSGGRVIISMKNVVRAHGRPPYWKSTVLTWKKKRKTFVDTLINCIENTVFFDR